MKINSHIEDEAARYAQQHIEACLDKKYCYHNLDHTLYVVKAAREIAEGSGLSKHERRIVSVAAWFHDLGYSEPLNDHERSSAQLAEAFLKGHQVDQADIARVCACIEATRYPQNPSTMIERVICDADMRHLGDRKLIERCEYLRREWVLTQGKQFSDKEWYELNISFLSAHSFHTRYAQEEFQAGKEKNIHRLKKRLNALQVNDGNEFLERKFQPTRGVETFFRIASGTHLSLSGMADNKAHILLTINSLIVSVIISYFLTIAARSPYLILPTGVLLIVCLVTIVLAILSTKPKVSSGTLTMDQVREQKANLLFFGNFHNMDIDLYESGVSQMISNSNYLYRSMTRDIYYLGKVLAAKYRYLRLGYQVFMYGLIASVATFAGSLLWTAITQEV